MGSIRSTVRRTRRTRTPLEAIVTKRPDGALEWWIAKRLDSPNKHRGGHWRTRDNETKAWEQAIESALVVVSSDRNLREWNLITGTHTTKTRRIRPTYRQERRRLEIEIHVPSKRNFMKDDDNLAFSRKPIADALKRLGFICDDSRAWLDTPMPTQHVSDDGRFWTVVRLHRSSEANAAA